MAWIAPEVLQKFTELKILCVGDVMLDRYLYGSVERISPEAPVPVVHIQQEIEMLGGSGNVVRNLISLGAEVFFISTIGEDLPGQRVTRLLEDLPRVHPMILKCESQETTVKTRIIGNSQQILRADRESTVPLEGRLVQDFVYRSVSEVLGFIDILILSDYGKGILQKDLNQRIIQLARKKSIPVLVDPKSINYEDYAGATFITPNLKEFQAASRKKIISESELAEVAQQMVTHYGLEGILVTRSQEGMTLIEDQRPATHILTQAQEVYDVSGAGDTVIATFALGMGAGLSPFEAAKVANLAAGIVVGKFGTATVEPKELEAALSQKGVSQFSQKVASLMKAQEQVLKWQQGGQKIGFTNGCFDILHPGHITLLKEAKSRCHKLIVGLNSDASIYRLKGPTRPIQNQEARAYLLNSIDVVDMIVIFEEDTPLKLIQSLKPDLLVKGADYRLEDVVGASEIQNWGGEVYLVDLVPGQSTTKILKRGV